MFISIINNIQFNSHGKLFTDLMNMINEKHGLNINPIGTSISNECHLAIEKIRKFDNIISSISEEDFTDIISKENSLSDFGIYKDANGQYYGYVV